MTRYFIPAGSRVYRFLWDVGFYDWRYEMRVTSRAVIYDDSDKWQPKWWEVHEAPFQPALNRFCDVFRDMVIHEGIDVFVLPKEALPFRLLVVPHSQVQVLP